MLAVRCVLLIVVIGSLIAVLQLRGALKEISTGSLAAVNAAADARIDANDAKSNESLTLIARGSGQAFEPPGRLRSTPSPAISRASPTSRSWRANGRPTPTFTRQIRELDDGGQWDKRSPEQLAPDARRRTRPSVPSTAIWPLSGRCEPGRSSSLAAEQPIMIVAAILSFSRLGQSHCWDVGAWPSG
jgi:hypothetical protein